MSQENKDLLLKDLCARLPYGVIGEYSWKGNEPYNRELTGNLYNELNSSWSSTEDSKFTPYFRPMPSMTDIEKHIYDTMTRGYTICQQAVLFDWLNAHHFDYRGLIEKGLALEAPKDMYKID